MSIVIIHNKVKSVQWKSILKEAFPLEKIELLEQVQNPSDVDFAVAWKAEKGDYEKFPNLKVIQSTGAGTNHIFSILQAHQKVQVCRMSDPQLAIDLFEYIISAVLADMKNLSIYSNQQHQKVWKQHKYKTIKETKICVLGTGIIGSYVAEKLAESGFEVSAWSRTRKNLYGVQCFAGMDELKNALNRKDYLVSILPSHPSTFEIFNDRFFSMVTPGAVFINVGRGDLLDENALIRAIDTQIVDKAILDVFKQEPLPESHAFWDNEKICITPHVASITNIHSAKDQVIENYKRFKSGKNLLHLVERK